MAEIELSILAGQCLDRRLADWATLAWEVAVWEAARNASQPQRGLAVHHRGCPDQAQAALPCNLGLTSY